MAVKSTRKSGSRVHLPDCEVNDVESLICWLVALKLGQGSGRGPQRGSRTGVLESAFLTCELMGLEPSYVSLNA